MIYLIRDKIRNLVLSTEKYGMQSVEQTEVESKIVEFQRGASLEFDMPEGWEDGTDAKLVVSLGGDLQYRKSLTKEKKGEIGHHYHALDPRVQVTGIDEIDGVKVYKIVFNRDLEHHFIRTDPSGGQEAFYRRARYVYDQLNLASSKNWKKFSPEKLAENHAAYLKDKRFRMVRNVFGVLLSAWEKINLGPPTIDLR